MGKSGSVRILLLVMVCTFGLGFTSFAQADEDLVPSNYLLEATDHQGNGREYVRFTKPRTKHCRHAFVLRQTSNLSLGVAFLKYMFISPMRVKAYPSTYVPSVRREIDKYHLRYSKEPFTASPVVRHKDGGLGFTYRYNEAGPMTGMVVIFRLKDQPGYTVLVHGIWETRIHNMAEDLFISLREAVFVSTQPQPR